MIGQRGPSVFLAAIQLVRLHERAWSLECASLSPKGPTYSLLSSFEHLLKIWLFQKAFESLVLIFFICWILVAFLIFFCTHQQWVKNRSQYGIFCYFLIGCKPIELSFEWKSGIKISLINIRYNFVNNKNLPQFSNFSNGFCFFSSVKLDNLLHYVFVYLCICPSCYTQCQQQ